MYVRKYIYVRAAVLTALSYQQSAMVVFHMFFIGRNIRYGNCHRLQHTLRQPCLSDKLISKHVYY